MNIRVAQIKPNELNAFYNLFSSLLFDQFPEFSKKRINFFLKKHWNKMYYKKSLNKKNRLLIGAWSDAKLVGLMDSEKPSLGVSMCTWLMVEPEYQKKGVGKRLIETWIKESKELDAHSVYLYANKRNINYYKKLEFNHLGLWENSWFGDDLHIFTKTIQKPNKMKFEL
jgi:GNAT superfamily N-acetyltransferase